MVQPIEEWEYKKGCTCWRCVQEAERRWESGRTQGGPIHSIVRRADAERERIVVRPLNADGIKIRHHWHAGIDGQPVTNWNAENWGRIAEKLDSSWFNSIDPIDYENEGGKMSVYIGVVVEVTEDSREIVYTSDPFLATDKDQARNILLATAVRKDASLDPATLTVCLKTFDTWS